MIKTYEWGEIEEVVVEVVAIIQEKEGRSAVADLIVNKEEEIEK